MTDWIKMTNRGPISRAGEFVLGVVVGYVLAVSNGCRLPTGTTVAVEATDQGVVVHGAGSVQVNADGNLVLPPDALSGGSGLPSEENE